MTAKKTDAQIAKTGAPFGKGDHLYLIDASGYIFRAYHALPPLTRKSDGTPVGAVSGYANMMHKLLRELRDGERPTHLAAIFDQSEKTFRSDFYPDYKAHRPPPPEDLIPQFPLIRDTTKAFNVDCVELAGYEADDLIAAYACLARDKGGRVTIVSSDKDLMQLVEDGKIELYDTMKNKRIASPEVFEKFGVTPDKVIDVQSLAGDSVDNVPGVPGIGIKTAAELINTYGNLETLLERAGEIKQNKRRENLIEHAEKARISKRLVTLDCNTPVPTELDDLRVEAIDAAKLIGFLKAMEFSSLTKRIAAEFEVGDTGEIAATDVAVIRVPGAAAPKPAKAPVTTDEAWVPTARPGAAAIESALKAKFDVKAYRALTAADDLKAYVARAMAQGWIAFDTETTGPDPMKAELVGVSLALSPGDAVYVPLRHGLLSRDLMSSGEAPVQIAVAEAMAILRPMLEDPSILKIAHDAKYDITILAEAGIAVAPVDDTMLMSYALDAGLHGHGMDEIAKLQLGHDPISYKEVVGSGKKMMTFDAIEIPRATEYAAEDADVALRLHGLLKPQLTAKRVTTVYETLERPLIPVLAAMERAGILVDRETLSRLSGRFAQKMAALEEEIHELAGEKFNLGSPKQLGDILFGRMGLPGGRKTATGAWSTDADVLDELAAQGHALPQRILDWRQLSKLKGTYTDALPTYINAHTGRVHTNFQLAATPTGRLASTEPNLQNIPIRTEEGRSIRTAFIAPPGHVLISADYSQIELRLLAHVADIPTLKQAFTDGLDIHAMTASEMFGVPLAEMTSDVRRRAKAINFGIIYGISAFGLANNLSIPRGEADAYIKKYFERFPGIRDYMERYKQLSRDNGYVETIFGRRIHYPNIKASNPSLRAFSERASINAPLQGSAADIVRRAMIRVPPALAKAGLSARMLLQVHDELVFEAPEKEAAQTMKIVKDVMENAAHPAVQMSLPLTVEVKSGKNWDEAH
ncbi:DNA polymerase I [Alphaproteobacteria bacterium SO-S41]|nr:DNA polymerase I [Alphaproteobacteria bacterium SO-S41]